MQMSLLFIGLVTSSLAADDLPLNTIEKLDAKTRTFAQSHKSKVNDSLFKIARVFGEWKLYLGATAAMYADETGRGEIALKGGLIAGVAKESINVVVDRVRPRKAGDPTTYHSTKGRSFPSGHSASAFALATAIDENYGLGYVTYPVAAMTAMSRIYHDGHWFSDTLMGAGIGIASVKAVALHDEDRVEPSAANETFAIAMGAYTVADAVAFQMEKGPARTALRLGAIGLAASRIEDEEDVYGAFAGIAASLLLTRSFKKLKGLQIGPSSVSFAWNW
jgi:hypothetical protein